MGFERLEPRRLLASLPYGAMADDTAEFMLGRVVVTPVFFESSGAIDPNLEDWTPELIAETKAKIEQGVGWWAQTLAQQGSVHTLDFLFDYAYADNPVATGYEPISRISNDFVRWGRDFLQAVGLDQGGDAAFFDNIRAFNHQQRLAHDAHWAFTIFVANSDQDPDDSFALGGSFSRAFAYAGGLLFVSPSGRPPSTFAHETGHIFYAKDEYAGAGSYADHRGYYDTQNVNAWDNPAPGFVQADSIMAAGEAFDNAYANHTSSASSLEMIGWRDSDGDGVFDVLDVPHTLSGAGRYDPAAGVYRFVGQSSVQTLPNRNPEGLQNDITLGRITRAEYRLDGGPWKTASQYDDYAVSLDLTIPIDPAGFQTIEIRTIDDATGVTSPVFQGGPDEPAATAAQGLNGFVWLDGDGDGVWDADEPGLDGWTVQLVDAGGQPLELGPSLDPDQHPDDGQPLDDVLAGVRLEAVGGSLPDRSVYSRPLGGVASGDRGFAAVVWGGRVSTEWTDGSRRLKVQFDGPVPEVRLDAVGPAGGGGYGRLEAYNAAGQLLDRYTTGALAAGQRETMIVARPQADIAYVIAGGHADTTVQLDRLRVGPAAAAASGSMGRWSLPRLPAGDYTVQLVTPEGWAAAPAGGVRNVSLSAGDTVVGLNFAVRDAGAAWHNEARPADVNGDGRVSPIDALILINELVAGGPRQLSGSGGESGGPPYLDVSSDGALSAQDLLIVINELVAVFSGAGRGPAEPAEAGPAAADARATPAAAEAAADQAPAAEGVVASAATDEAGAAPLRVPLASGGGQGPSRTAVVAKPLRCGKPPVGENEADGGSGAWAGPQAWAEAADAVWTEAAGRPAAQRANRDREDNPLWDIKLDLILDLIRPPGLPSRCGPLATVPQHAQFERWRAPGPA